MLSTALRRGQPLGIQAGRSCAIGLQTRWPAPSAGLILSRAAKARPKLSFGPLRIVQRTCLSTKPPLQPNTIDREFEREVAGRKLEARPEEVSSTSTVRQVFEQSQSQPESEQELLAGLKSDVDTVKETFALGSVPREPFALGLAGTIPYLVTSLSTLYLSWNLNTERPAASNFINSILLEHDTASDWLALLEPIQVGYGAVIISFLGAIHWGLEFGEKQTASGRTAFRYGAGVLAPAMAWPTIFMSVEWALTTQFAAFIAMYLTDSRATFRGWVPSWYATYRFVLTSIVGAALVISLIGRAKVGQGRSRLLSGELREELSRTPASDYRNWAEEEEKERRKIQREKKEEEERRKRAEQKAREEEELKKEEESKVKEKEQAEKSE